MNNRLYKMEEGKMLCGVCAGLAEYLKLDVSLVRILTVVGSFMACIGVVVYFVAAVILPWKHDTDLPNSSNNGQNGSGDGWNAH